MSNVKDKVVFDVETKTIYITNTVTVADISSLVNPMMEFERGQDDWPNAEHIQWNVVVKPNNS